MDLTEQEYRVAWAASGKAARVGRNYLDRQDLNQEILMWLLRQRQEKREEWVERKLLNLVLYRRGLTIIDRYRRQATGAQQGDFMYYTPGLVEYLLPDVWDLESMAYGNGSPTPTHDKGRGKTSPAESNNRIAMLCDVRSALESLPEKDRLLLRDLYADGGAPLEIVAAAQGVTVDAVRKRARRVVSRLCERLGGEPPWWTGTRRVKSNAQAQAETQ